MQPAKDLWNMNMGSRIYIEQGAPHYLIKLLMPQQKITPGGF
jgi:hypothetical protein